MVSIVEKILFCVLAFGVAALMVPITMRGMVDQYVFSSVERAPHANAILVLGASVARGIPSPVLAERTDTAIALYQSGKAPKILVTGDSADISHDEVTPVRKYLTQAGIPSSDIFLDHAGFDTYSSMYRARDVYQSKSLLIVTQDFHMPRALWIARRLGIPAYGVVAGSGGSIYDYTREIPASTKALIDVIFERVPTHLEPIVPLSGDGAATW